MGEACAAQWWSVAVSRFAAWQERNGSYPAWAEQYLRGYFSIGVCDAPTADYYEQRSFEDLVSNIVDLGSYAKDYLDLCLPDVPTLFDAPPPG